MATQRKFIDLDMEFSAHPATGDVVRLYDESAIKASVKHLVLTHFYSRPFHPEIGSHVAGLLFELNTETTRFAIANSINQVINNYDPRVTLDGLLVNFEENDNAYRIEVTLSVLGILEVVSIEFLLNRVR